jgi:hypothetical protein
LHTQFGIDQSVTDVELFETLKSCVL